MFFLYSSPNLKGIHLNYILIYESDQKTLVHMNLTLILLLSQMLMFNELTYIYFSVFKTFY